VEESNRRRKERIRLELAAQLSVGDQDSGQDTLHVSTSDISTGGAFFHTERSLPVGTKLEVDLILPLDELKKVEGDSATLKVSGIVARTEEKGVAISFTGLKILCINEQS